MGDGKEEEKKRNADLWMLVRKKGGGGVEIK